MPSFVCADELSSHVTSGASQEKGDPDASNATSGDEESETGESAEQRRERLKIFYGQLTQVVSTADNYLADSGSYTAQSLAQLKEARDAAMKMYEEATADSGEVSNQALTVMLRIIALESASSKQGASASEKESPSDALDIKNLPDGEYTISLNVLKTDKKTKSMGDQGISHTAALVAGKGKLTLTLSFKSVTVGSSKSYLSTVKYFKSGYTVSKDGVPQGATATAKVLTYQLDSSKKKIKDAYGSNYPKTVSLLVIDEVKEDGFVPLAVTIPIMELISPGNGTQPMYLKLDLGSIKKKAAAKSDKESKKDSDATSAKTAGGTKKTESSGSGPAGLSEARAADDGESVLPLANAESGEGSADNAAEGDEAAEEEGSGESEEDADDGEEAPSASSQLTAASAGVVPSQKQAPLKGCLPAVIGVIVLIGAAVAGSVLLHCRQRLGGRRWE